MIGRALKGLMVAAVAAPLLAACVVYDSTGGENVTVQVNDRDAAPAEAGPGISRRRPTPRPR